jgi:hypothetical protein
LTYQPISSAEFVDSIIAAQKIGGLIGAILAAAAFAPLHRSTNGMQFLDGAFSNENCGHLEGSALRWRAFASSCRFLSGLDLYLLAHSIVNGIVHSGGSN